jgi:hypothetical protein
MLQYLPLKLRDRDMNAKISSVFHLTKDKRDPARIVPLRGTPGRIELEPTYISHPCASTRGLLIPTFTQRPCMDIRLSHASRIS